MEYVCYKTSVAAIGNGFVEVSQTERKVTLVGFNNYLSKKSILIGAIDNSTNLPNGTILDHLNDKSLPYGVTNSLLSTTQSNEFFVAVHDVDKIHSG